MQNKIIYIKGNCLLNTVYSQKEHNFKTCLFADVNSTFFNTNLIFKIVGYLLSVLDQNTWKV